LIVFFVVLPLSVVLLTAFWMFDKLVRLEYASYRADWEQDGRPNGFLFHPPETKELDAPRSWVAFNRCAFAWLFRTPEWMRQDERALRWVFWLRVSVLTWNVGILGWLFIPFFA
jgi:hypothetical protein